MSAILCLEGISKSFGYRKILENINFSITSGEFVLLVGNNGAGKSTLLRIISSIMKPTKGKIFFKGKNQREILMLWLKKMGFLSEETQLYSDLSPSENLHIFGTFYEVKNLNLKIKKLLLKIGLEHVSNLPVRNFSIGMKKRLMIGKLMLYEPEILLLDEPFSGLDVKSTKWFENYLNEFNQKGGTILMVTHQFDQLLEFANRIMLLQNQKINKIVSTNEISSDSIKFLLEK